MKSKKGLIGWIGILIILILIAIGIGIYFWLTNGAEGGISGAIPQPPALPE